MTASHPREHVHRVRVYYEDTDAGGVVYHSNYLRFAERARTEMLRALGFDHVTLRQRDGLSLAVRRCVADYRRPARLDDHLEVRTRPERVSGASFWVDQRIRRGDETLVALMSRIVCVRSDGRPSRLPADLRDAVGPETLPDCRI